MRIYPVRIVCHCSLMRKGKLLAPLISKRAVKSDQIGLQYFGTKMVSMVEAVEQLVSLPENHINDGRKKTVLIHCWRGGMRSAGVAWLLDLYGWKVYMLSGGYKIFRKWVLQQFEKPYSFKVIGGYTGSGKTEILKTLKQLGENIIDLESLASHRGSALEIWESQSNHRRKCLRINLHWNFQRSTVKYRQYG